MAGLLQKWGLGVELRFGADEALRDMSRAQRGVGALKGAFGGLKEAGSRLASGLGQLGMVLAPIAAGLGFAAFKASGLAADLEAQMLTMKVLLGSAAKAQQLVGEIRAYAAATPFEEGDLIEGSKRLLKLTGSNVDANMDLLKLVSQMAALNPTRSFGDSAEALLDAAQGTGFERIKEMGFFNGMSQDDFKKLGKPGGKAWADGIVESFRQQVADKLQGGDLVAELGNTFGGRLSTIKDAFGNVLKDIGKVINEEVGLWFEPLSAIVKTNQATILGGVKIAIGWIREAMAKARPYIKMIENWWNSLGGEGRQRVIAFGVAFGALVTVALPIGGVLTAIAVAVSGVVTALSALVPLLEGAFALLVPEVILPAAVAFAALGAAVLGFYGMFKREGEGPLSFLKRMGGGALETLRKGFDFVSEAAGAFWQSIWFAVGPAVSAAWAELLPTLQALGNRLGMMWDALNATKGPAVNWIGIIRLMGAAVGWLAVQGIGRLVTAGKFLAGVFQTVIDIFQPIIAYVSLLIRMWGLLASGQVTAGQAIHNAIMVVVSGIVSLVALVLNLLLTVVEGVIRAVATVVNAVPGATKFLGSASSLGADQVAQFRASISNDFAEAVAGAELKGQEAASAKADAASPTVNVTSGPVKADVNVSTSVQVDGKEIARAQGDQAVRSGERGKTRAMPAEQRGRVLRSGLTVTPLQPAEVF